MVFKIIRLELFKLNFFFLKTKTELQIEAHKVELFWFLNFYNWCLKMFNSEVLYSNAQ